MKLKSATLAFLSLSAFAVTSSQGATLVFNSDTVGTTGGALDGQTSGSFAVPEISGLIVTIQSISTSSSPGVLNSTASAFGINSAGGSDGSSTFDEDFNEFVTLSFNKEVTITSFKLGSFTDTDAFTFAGTAILDSDADGSNVYTFLTPLIIAANTSFSMGATSGSVSFENIVLTAVPEPSAALLGAVGFLALRRRR
jgi:hypothetical protein